MNGRAEPTLSMMCDALAHRGPDDSGQWIDAPAGIGLGHRRLSIIDVSQAAHQPMHSASGRYVLVFNGEIYNHQSLRHELASSGSAPEWRGTSDTESLLAAIEAWGIGDALAKATGMFALAVWDREAASLTLARDRFGEKPLYVGWLDGCFVFASELEAVRRHWAFRGALDAQAVRSVVQFGYVQSPRSIYAGIEKLTPGTYRVVHRSGTVEEHRFWDLNDEITSQRDKGFSGSFHDAVVAVEERLSGAVASQMEADVPLGAFLSGGIDSSTIAALMQAQSSRPVQTYSIGFDRAAFDESAHARAVAEHLGTQHTTLRVTERDALNTVPEIARFYDEPFADASQIPTLLLSRLTRQEVTVALSGDGGDELFGGYARHVQGARLWDRVRHLPIRLRRAAARFFNLISAEQWNDAVALFERHIAHRALIAQPGRKIEKAASALGKKDLAGYYLDLLSSWPDPDDVLDPSFARPSTDSADTPRAPDGLNTAECLMAWDTGGYLVDDILVKVDRAAMAASLETRVPMLDPSVFGLAWSLPSAFKAAGPAGKQVLREVLYRHVPRHIVDRPKAGFDVPIGAWLRGDLQGWAENLLGDERLEATGVFRTQAVRDVWHAHVSGAADHSRRLWPVLMLQAWLNETNA